jgi:hypothetical protein
VARRLTEFQYAPRTGNSKYPWKRWTNGEPWEVVHGKDFECTPGSLVVYLYHKATSMDMNVRVSVRRGKGKRPDQVVFQFWKRVEDEPAASQYRKLKRVKAGIHGRRTDQGR